MNTLPDQTIEEDKEIEQLLSYQVDTFTPPHHNRVNSSSSVKANILEEDQAAIVQPFHSQSETEVKIKEATNKSLSLIEEEAEEEFFTNNDESNSQKNGFGESQKMMVFGDEEYQDRTNTSNELNCRKHYIRNNIILDQPGILKDIEQMEKDFTGFLELIYN